jgi:signal transduction histidine kinase
MSLRLRLILLTLALVAAVALGLSWLYLDDLADSLPRDAIDRNDFAGQQIQAYLADHITQHSRDYPAPAGVEETKALWSQIAATDEHIQGALEKMMAAPGAILEINVAGQDGTILVSSNPGNAGKPMARLEPIANLRQGGAYRRLLNMVSRRPDYASTIPLGAGGEDLQPVFTIQVVTSNVLLREDLLPRLRWLGLLSAGALAATLVLAVLTTTGALRPIRRIEQTIDRIASGSFRGEETAEAEGTAAAKEFRVMQSKLLLLGQQMRGATQDASQLRRNVDRLLERLASDLDVATRLAAISKLTGGVAHEIKNPLNAIVLRLDLLRERLGEPEEELRKEIDILSREALRLDRVVKTFLDFSRPVELHPRELDLAALAREVADLVGPQARLAGVEVAFEAPSGPAVMRGDPDVLKQAVLNVVTNALEAMSSGGRLCVSAAQENSRVRVEIADTGPGIPPEVRSRVGQLYFSTKAKGSGIGLAMTYRAVQLHNGVIDFTTELGRGTTFRLEFPSAVSHV